MVERKYCAVPLSRIDIDTEEKFISAAKEYGYCWNSNEFKDVLDKKKVDIHGMWIKSVNVSI